MIIKIVVFSILVIAVAVISFMEFRSNILDDYPSENGDGEDRN